MLTPYTNTFIVSDEDKDSIQRAFREVRFSPEVDLVPGDEVTYGVDEEGSGFVRYGSVTQPVQGSPEQHGFPVIDRGIDA